MFLFVFSDTALHRTTLAQEYKDSDFCSGGGKRSTRYSDHCPVCSLDLRKIINAVKAGNGDENGDREEGDLAAGPSAGNKEVSWLLLYSNSFIPVHVACKNSVLPFDMLYIYIYILYK